MTAETLANAAHERCRMQNGQPWSARPKILRDADTRRTEAVLRELASELRDEGFATAADWIESSLATGEASDPGHAVSDHARDAGRGTPT